MKNAQKMTFIVRFSSFKNSAIKAPSCRLQIQTIINKTPTKTPVIAMVYGDLHLLTLRH